MLTSQGSAVIVLLSLRGSGARRRRREMASSARDALGGGPRSHIDLLCHLEARVGQRYEPVRTATFTVQTRNVR